MNFIGNSYLVIPHIAEYSIIIKNYYISVPPKKSKAIGEESF